MRAPRSLLVELLCEELPPKALSRLSESFARTLAAELATAGLCAADAAVTPYATPRRLAARIAGVAGRGDDRAVRQKLMPAAVGLDASGMPTPALQKKLAALGLADVAPAQLIRESDGKAENLFVDTVVPGAALAEALQRALETAIARLPIPKVMSYQLESGCEQPGWSSVSFVRPAHGLVALHGADVVAVSLLGLQAGRSTRGHRFESPQVQIELRDADSYAAQLAEEGAVVASFAERRALIASQLAATASAVGGVRPIEDEALLDEVTALVERPNVLVGQFDVAFLAVPQECLILTMKANQKYFPLVDASGALTNRFLLVSNISPADPSAVITGNERVVRPRLADAQFFFEQDRKTPLAGRVAGLDRVVYHNKLGSQGDRSRRVVAIAEAIARRWQGDALAAAAAQAAALAKADLVTDMVGEFPELQGIMGRYYALHDGLGADIADAVEDHYRPRFAGDALPRNAVGTVVALADKLETLTGLFGIGEKPSGDRDPFALRRNALGVLRILIEQDLPLSLPDLLADAVAAFAGRIEDPSAALAEFIFDRLAGSMRESGYSAQQVDAVLALTPPVLAEVPARLAAVRTFTGLAEAEPLAAANKRVGNILKKAESVPASVDPARFVEDAERGLFSALQAALPASTAAFERGDLTASLQALAALRGPVDAFFDGVMVNAEDAALRDNRLALLGQLHAAMNRVAELGRLAT